MNFKDEIVNLENEISSNTYITKIGTLPVLITAVHTMEQTKEDGTLKYSEPFTKGIAKYISEKLNTSYYIKLKDTGIDSNSITKETFKTNLIKYIKDNNIKLVIDLHGANKNRPFDVEFGTLNNISADFTTIKELEDAFIENGVTNIEYNNPFKGGGITQYVFSNTDIDVIQIEINHNYRDINNIENIEKICNALIDFIKMYVNFN